LKTERLIVLLVIAALSACRTAPLSNAPAVPEKPPHLTATKFVAYGDSITEGFVQRCPGNEPTDRDPTGKDATPPMSRFRFFLEQGRAQPSPTAYPAKLQELLEARYPSQTFTVVN
jgi:hypothetical protein